MRYVEGREVQDSLYGTSISVCRSSCEHERVLTCMLTSLALAHCLAFVLLGCAGCFNVHAALSLYAQAFEKVGKLDKLEEFVAFNGPDFYGLPRKSVLVFSPSFLALSSPFPARGLAHDMSTHPTARGRSHSFVNPGRCRGRCPSLRRATARERQPVWCARSSLGKQSSGKMRVWKVNGDAERECERGALLPARRNGGSRRRSRRPCRCR